jgi:hypothetical protein
MTTAEKMRAIGLGIVLLGLTVQSCISPAERWKSGVRAEIDATTFAPGDSMTVTLVNEASAARYTSPCWALLRLETGAWRTIVTTPPGIACAPAYAIASGGTVEQRVAIWPAGLTPPGSGTYRLWYTVTPVESAADPRGDFVATPSFVVQ